MKKVSKWKERGKRATSLFLSAMLCLMTFFPYLPSLQVQAAEKDTVTLTTAHGDFGGTHKLYCIDKGGLAIWGIADDGDVYKKHKPSEAEVSLSKKEQEYIFWGILSLQTTLGIKKANDMGVICGVTTNPSIIAKEGRDFNEVIKEIAAIVDGPISGEVKATTVDAEGMIKEGREIAKIHKNMVVKLPTTAEGLKACRVLSGEGIKTNLTLIFNVPQAILAARAGATYVSPFVGRIDDISMDGLQLIRDIAAIFKTHDIKAQIISASVRNACHVIECAKAGADLATVPYSVIEQMLKHPLTAEGIEKFQKDYRAVFGG